MDIDAEKAVIQTFVDKGNFHAAMNIAISALNQCRRSNDQAGVNTFLAVIRGIADTMTDAFGGD